MLSNLKFVQGAVATKDFQPALTHFRIKDNRIIGYDGVIAISAPIDIEITATPKATSLVKAIERCKGDRVVVHMNEGGHLSLRSGRFRATVECLEDSEILDNIAPEGDFIDVDTELVPALKQLQPFISKDASRPWSRGILLRDQSAYATNNIIIAEYWLGADMPNINVPASAIDEINRIGEEPIKIQLSKNNVTFHFEGDRWLRAQLLVDEWPDISGLMERAYNHDGHKPIPKGFFEAVETLRPFVEDDGRIRFTEDGLVAGKLEESGASVDFEGLPDFGAYHYKQLLLLQGSVDKIDFSTHPKPCPFIGPNMRGVFLGMVDA